MCFISRITKPTSESPIIVVVIIAGDGVVKPLYLGQRLTIVSQLLILVQII